MNTSYVISVILVCGACTFLERALPFLIFNGREVPKAIKYLGKVLPMAIMASLVIYCLKGISFDSSINWAPEIIASIVTVGLHLYKRNAMLSIFGGTICCMLLMHLF